LCLKIKSSLPGSYTKVNLLSKPLTVNVKLKGLTEPDLELKLNSNENDGLTAKSFFDYTAKLILPVVFSETSARPSRDLEGGC